MRWMKNTIQFLWPSSSVECEIKKLENLTKDMAEIVGANWSKNPDLYLSEIRRLYEEEHDRRRYADAKATNYLLVAAALVSILTYFEGFIWTAKAGAAPQWLGLLSVLCALLYVGAFGFWAFRALRASAYTTVGAVDLAKLSKFRQDGKSRLILLIAEAVRQNQDQTNKKITSVNLAHAFLFRAFLAFCFIAILQAGWGIYTAIFSEINSATTAQHNNAIKLKLEHVLEASRNQ